MVVKNDRPKGIDRKSSRNVGTKKLINNYYIFCEGTSTEPEYFTAMKNEIASDAAYRKVVHLEILGKGRGTSSLLQEAKKYVKTNDVSSGQVWCVYDKDEFSDDSFNQTAQQIEQLTGDKRNKLSYHAAWSNESIEYWFLLHFCDNTAALTRGDYVKKLREYYKKLKIPGKYTKNKESAAQLFTILTEYGEPKQAIKRANRALKNYKENDIKNVPSKINPGTVVYRLVQELAKYFPKNLKEKYLEV